MKKTKTVYDTNVIIDFKAGKIREAMFSSGETVAINREVYEDELRKERKYLAQYQRTGVLEIINRNKQIDSLFFYLKNTKPREPIFTTCSVSQVRSICPRHWPLGIRNFALRRQKKNAS